MQPINQAMQPKQQVTAASFAAKFGSKKECFNFLSVEVGAYLCHHETLNIYFLKELLSGAKKCKSTQATSHLTAVCRRQVRAGRNSVCTTV